MLASPDRITINKILKGDKVAVRYFKTKDGKILISKRDVSSERLKARYTEVDKNGKVKAQKKATKKKK